MIDFALVFGFLKIIGHIVSIFEESRSSNYPSNIKQLANMHISHKLFIIITCYLLLHYDLHVSNVCDIVS